MTPDTLEIAPDACYLALKARDARFDGCFFTGVTSTGIYCRPVCAVRTPRRENCRFFGHATQAERAGFRPCLRCRPELAPHSQAWSVQDSSATLAHQAAQLLDSWLGEPQAWGDEVPSVARLAARLGVSDRHLRRLFEAHFGVAPLAYLQTRRLLTAKHLLTDTALPVAQIAHLAGFASLRRFNAAFAAHYGLAPTRLRRDSGGGANQTDTASPGGIRLRLAWRPPYDLAALLGFFRARRIAGMEAVSDGAEAPRYARTLSVEHAGRAHTGWLELGFDPARCQAVLSVSEGLHDALPLLIHRARAAFDLDADPKAINAVLAPAFPGLDGLRVPGAWDGFELAVRAVLGQQITVAAARTLAQRLLERFGEPLATPLPGLTRLFPSAAALAQAQPSDLGELGIVRQRQAAIQALAAAVRDKRLALHAGAPVHATVEALKALPGIGDWTAQYIAMRALRWPDAFPAGDVALHKALGVQGSRHAAREAEALSQAWRPWRSYAVLRAWSRL
jgi:AraC family transcriptional regulator of adaptative response / DNA-3-methyladenine glycosylase II